ncbi:MAG: hypothetical protein U0Q16_36695 [Bryobacteraceae bacterium]
MTSRRLIGLLAVPLWVQAFDAGSVRGKYFFVQVIAGGESTPEIRSLGGSIVFDGQRGYAFAGKTGAGADKAQPGSGEGTYSVAENGRLSMGSPARSGETIDVVWGAGGNVLIGSAPEGKHGIFVAAKAPTGTVDAKAIQGHYAGAYLSFRNGAVRGLTSAFVDLRSEGKGKFESAAITGHAAWLDDVNRVESPPAASYSIKSDGTGTIRFADRSDLAAGERELMIAEGGDLLLAYGSGAADRDILLLVRTPVEASTLSLQGQYFIADLGSSNSYVYRPEKARLNSGLGAAAMDGAGNSIVAEGVWTGNRKLHLTTSNEYRVYSDGTGMLGGRANPSLKNLALGAGAQIFAGVQVGTANQLSLTHGIFAGVRLPPTSGTGVHLSSIGSIPNTDSPFPQLPRIAPGAAIALAGSDLAPRTAAAKGSPVPFELAGVKVKIDGSAVPILMVSNQQIHVLVPFQLAAEQASIQVDNNGRLSNTILASVGSTNPAAFRPEDPAVLPPVAHSDSTPVSDSTPARSGEAIVLYARGLGAVEPPVAIHEPAPATPPSRVTDREIQVLFDGKPGQLSFAGLAPGLTGVYKIDVKIPAIAPPSGRASVAIRTSDAFFDVLEIPIARP